MYSTPGLHCFPKRTTYSILFYYCLILHGVFIVHIERSLDIHAKPSLAECQESVCKLVTNRLCSSPCWGTSWADKPGTGCDVPCLRRNVRCPPDTCPHIHTRQHGTCPHGLGTQVEGSCVTLVSCLLPFITRSIWV